MTAEVLRDVLGAGGIGRLELMTYYSALVAPGVADALVEACGDTLRTVNLWLEVAPSYVEEYVDVGEVLVSVRLGFGGCVGVAWGRCATRQD